MRCGSGRPGGFFGNPTSGPASSPWSNGGRSPAITPSPPVPTPACRADIFSECFLQCSGDINVGTPGPICGWTFFGNPGSDAIFTPGQVVLSAPSNSALPGIVKSLPSNLLSVFNLTLQWFFTETTNNGSYEF